MSDYIQNFLDVTKLGIKVLFLCIPAAILVFLGSLGSGNLNYQVTKDTIKTAYVAADNVLDVADPTKLIDTYKNLKSMALTVVKDTLESVGDTIKNFFNWLNDDVLPDWLSIFDFFDREPVIEPGIGLIP